MATLLFDYGGTLDSHARHWSFVLRDAYLPLVPAAMREAFDAVWRDAYVHGERTLAREPIVEATDTFGALLLRKTRVQLAYIAQHAPALHAALPADTAESVAAQCDDAARACTREALPMLEALRAAGHTLVLVTNFYGNIHAVLADYGLLHLWSAVVESAVVGVRKPDPAIWRLGLEAVSGNPATAWAIGDSYSKDIAPAAALGLHTLWYKGQEWEQKAYDESLPTRIATDTPTLFAILRSAAR